MSVPRHRLPACLQYAPNTDPAEAAEFWSRRQGHHADAIERCAEAMTALLHLQGALERVHEDGTCVTTDQVKEVEAVSRVVGIAVKAVVNDVADKNKKDLDRAEKYRAQCEAIEFPEGRGK